MEGKPDEALLAELGPAAYAALKPVKAIEPGSEEIEQHDPA